MQGQTGDPRENPPTSGIAVHDSHLRKFGVNRPGIDPCSPWWEASSLTAQLPWPQNIKIWNCTPLALLGKAQADCDESRSLRVLKRAHGGVGARSGTQSPDTRTRALTHSRKHISNIVSSKAASFVSLREDPVTPFVKTHGQMHVLIFAKMVGIENLEACDVRRGIIWHIAWQFVRLITSYDSCSSNKPFSSSLNLLTPLPAVELSCRVVAWAVYRWSVRQTPPPEVVVFVYARKHDAVRRLVGYPQVWKQRYKVLYPCTDYSPPTPAKVRLLTRPPVNAVSRRVFSGISRIPLPLHSGATQFPPRFTLVGSRDLDVKGNGARELSAQMLYLDSQTSNGPEATSSRFETTWLVSRGDEYRVAGRCVFPTSAQREARRGARNLLAAVPELMKPSHKHKVRLGWFVFARGAPWWPRGASSTGHRPCKLRDPPLSNSEPQPPVHSLQPPYPYCAISSPGGKTNVEMFPGGAKSSGSYRSQRGWCWGVRRGGNCPSNPFYPPPPPDLAVSKPPRLVARTKRIIASWQEMLAPGDDFQVMTICGPHQDGNTARLARRGDEALDVRVSVARIAPSLLDLQRE
ncbi:hypothetical protein PR048_018995, partial [Dryococelus australis]